MKKTNNYEDLCTKSVFIIRVDIYLDCVAAMIRHYVRGDAKGSFADIGLN